MSNIMDYLAWRGDLDFGILPLNEVDALILCQLSYMNMDGLVSSDFTQKQGSGLTLSTAAQAFAAAPDYAERSNMGALINQLSADLLKVAGRSKRFGKLEISGFINKIDEEKAEQFSAITFSFGKEWNFIAYRGTDDSIVGWKEDFNLAYMESVPAQLDALEYFDKAAAALKGDFFLGGHSKGGNLALYSAAKAEAKLQKKILTIYDNDGPGFPEDFFSSPGYLAIADKLRTFVPRQSIVGMLFSNTGNYVTVENELKDMVMQHDPFSWQTGPRAFIVSEGLGDESRFVGKTLNEWFRTLSTEEKKVFVESVFHVLAGSNAKTNFELTRNWFDSLVGMKKSFDSLPKASRDTMWKNMQTLVRIIADEFKRKVTADIPLLAVTGNIQ
ncbi:MAG: DUF2974 domain-containing protein [Treponema sp.]|nr:DUF2974 domain-containing protein [Treponema sp.]